MSAPLLRFRNNGKDYPDWKETKLSEITEFRSTKANNTNEKYIGTENMLQNCAGIVLNNNDEPRRGTAFYKGDILSSNIRPYLKKSWFATWDGIASNDVLVFKVLEGIPRFVYLLLSSDRFFHYSMKGSKPGNKMPRGDKNYIKNMVVEIPFPEEQKQIADFFSDIDVQIENCQQALNNLENQRKELLSQVFSKKLRFKGDDGSDYPDWEKDKFENFISIKSGKSPSKVLSPTGSVPYFKVDSLNSTPKYLRESIYKIEYNESNLVKKGSIIFPKRGESIRANKIRILAVDAFMDTNLMSITLQKHNAEFVLYSMIANNFSKVADYTNIPQINNKHVKPYVIELPCLEEQQKIADFFSVLDERIELERIRLQTIQVLKKGLFQQMFC